MALLQGQDQATHDAQGADMLQRAIIGPEGHAHPEMTCLKTGLLLGCRNGWELAQVCLIIITTYLLSFLTPFSSSILDHALVDQLTPCKKSGWGAQHLIRQSKIMLRSLNHLNLSEISSRMCLGIVMPPSKCLWNNC